MNDDEEEGWEKDTGGKNGNSRRLNKESKLQHA
jgi:hypothetical protein